MAVRINLQFESSNYKTVHRNTVFSSIPQTILVDLLMMNLSLSF